MKIQELFEEKGSKVEAGYQSSPKNGQKCINCTMWRDPNKCTAVAGDIAANGWCKWYAGGAYGKHGKKLKEDGRIVKGVNTTVDVGVDQTKIEAAKYGNRVTRDGFPPTLNSNGKISEQLTDLQQAIVEGGHTLENPRFTFLKEIQSVELDEGLKDTLRKLAMIGTVGATAAGGIATAKAYDKYASAQPTSISQPAAPTKTTVDMPTSPISKTPAKTDLKAKPDLTAKPTIRPMPNPYYDQDEPTKPKPRAKISFDDLGSYGGMLADEATKSGIEGTELLAFLAQTAHETRFFEDLVENGDEEYFRMYDPKYAPKKAKELGNTDPGDGEKYKGRGFIHLTGKYNYTLAQEHFGVPLIKNPELAAEPKLAAKIAVWFWMTEVRPEVTDFSNVKAVTRPINPGLKGFADRKEKFRYMTMAFPEELKKSDK